jgi:hypothetical protein
VLPQFGVGCFASHINHTIGQLSNVARWCNV